MTHAKPLPADFAETRQKLGSVAHLTKHYGVSWRVVGRWIKEAGMPSLRGEHLKGKQPAFGFSAVKGLNNYGPEEQAADILRKRAAVFRCDENGRANPKGRFWRVGNVVCDADELLARAARRAA